jgi:hypothetical protein
VRHAGVLYVFSLAFGSSMGRNMQAIMILKSSSSSNMPVECTRVLLDSYCGLMHGKLENIKIVFQK